MTTGPGVFNVATHAKALHALRVTTLSNITALILPGQVFAVCPSAAARAWRDGLVAPLEGEATDDDAAAFVGLRSGYEREALEDLHRHGGRQFKTTRNDYAVDIERVAEATKPRPVALSLGGGEVGETPLPPAPAAFS